MIKESKNKKLNMISIIFILTYLHKRHLFSDSITAVRLLLNFESLHFFLDFLHQQVPFGSRHQLSDSEMLK